MFGVTCPDKFPVAVFPTDSGPFANGIWTGMVTVPEAVTNMVLRIDDGLGHDGESNPFDTQVVVLDSDEDGIHDTWEQEP